MVVHGRTHASTDSVTLDLGTERKTRMSKSSPINVERKKREIVEVESDRFRENAGGDGRSQL